MKILAIGAHPDDIEIFMYGILSIYKCRGDKIFTIVATDGAKGGTEIESILINRRKKEAFSGLAKLSTPIFLDIPDGELGNNPKHKAEIKNNVKKIMPDLIITHSLYDYHTDHCSLSLLLSSIASHYIPVLHCDTLMGINFQPNYYVDITDYFELKKNAILSHKSQNPNRFVDLFKLMNAYRAAQCNLPKGSYVEGYRFTPSFPFSDIRDILPPSPKIRPFHIETQQGFL